MTKPLLIEILVEELPAIPFLKELPQIEKKWLNILEEFKLVTEFNFFYTPRRLILWHREFKVKQDNEVKELFGPPVKIAYKDGVPTNAALGFAKKCGVDLSEISTISQPKGDVLYYKKEIIGKEAKTLLNEMVNKFLQALDFGKSMRWGDLKESFIRPIRNICAIFGEEVVEIEAFGVKSNNLIYPHRMVGFEPIEISFAGEYFCKIDKAGVIIYPDERRKKILDEISKIEKEYCVKVEIDEDLLDEIVVLTEYPTALIGKFDEKFLILPKEVIITSMKEHQRYFAVFKDDKLVNNFIVVSNAKTNNFNKIIAGNEKVLRARLSDALFFWEQDLKDGLNPQGLKNISFMDKLGSMYDKELREVKIGEILANSFNLDKEKIKTALLYSKADLLTNMVYEFTELQGIMGYYYAKEAGFDSDIYISIKEQYLPNSATSKLPSTLFSAVVSLSNKLDNIFALFSIGLIPSGNKDPFALRRSAIGVIRICIEYKLDLELYSIIKKVQKEYNNLNSDKVIEFFKDRLFKYFKDINPSVIKAVLKSDESSFNIFEIYQKLIAVNDVVKSSDYKELNQTFKRVANIIKDFDFSSDIKIDENLLSLKEEIELYNMYNKIRGILLNTYEEKLDKLLELKPYLDSFFDNVFVNDKDENIKTNRKSLIALIYLEFKQIADIKEISV